MPHPLPLPSPVVSRTRHCTALAFTLPIGGAPSCTASFTDRATLADGTHHDTPEASVTLTHAELSALPTYAATYGLLSAAVHAKRSTYDATP